MLVLFPMQLAPALTTGWVPGASASELRWLQVLTDLATWGACAAISAVLTLLVVRHRRLPLPRMFWLLCGFVFLIGAAELFEGLRLWASLDRSSGLARLSTALVAWATVLVILSMLPRILAQPTVESVTADLRQQNVERQRAEASLRESEARLRGIVNTAVDGIITINSRGIIESVNPAVERLFGYAESELIGHNVSLLMPSPYHEEHDQYLRNYERTGHARIIGIGREVVGRRKDGSVFPLDLAVSEVRLGERRLYTGMLRDITQRKQAEQERARLLASERAARSEAERVSRMKDEFLATLSHELRTPLNAIFGWAQLLSRSEPDPELMSEGLTTIERNARVQTHMVEDLLDMSRIISGKIRLDVREIDLPKTVKAAIETVAPAAESKGIALMQELPKRFTVVRGDPNRLQQVLWNLLSNAIKFTPRGGEVRVGLEQVNSHIEIHVRDTGKGIPAEFLPYVFERFRQIDASSKREHGGLGLGLAIVRQLVELHGGEVRASSEGAGRGATFTISLPISATYLAEPASQPESTDEHDRPAAALPRDLLAGLSVLVVDDEADARELVRRVLKQYGAEVRAAGAAEPALEILRSRWPEVVISDIGMPHRDGYDLIRELRAWEAEAGGRVAAVALTAFAGREDSRRCLEAGFDHYLAKPVEATVLATAVAKVAGRTEQVAT